MTQTKASHETQTGNETMTTATTNERYAFLSLPLQKHESFDSREEAENRLAEVKKLKRLAPGRRCSVGTNGFGTWWIDYTVQ